MTVGQNYFYGGVKSEGAGNFYGDLTAHARLLYNNAYPVTTADDTTTTLTAAAYPDVVALGSGVLHWIDLGDATTYSLYKRFTVANASSEIVGVKNSDSTVWVRLGPHEACACTLINNGAAAGVWHVVIQRIADPRYGMVWKDDFEANVITGIWGITAAGAAAGAGVDGSFRIINSKGVGYMTTGTTATGSVDARCLNPVIFQSGPIRFSAKIRLPNKSDAVEEYLFRIGIIDTVASDVVDGVYIENDRAVHGNTNFWRCSAAASARTKTDTGIDVVTSTTGQLLEFESSSNTTRADYWINRVYAGSVTTTLPDSTQVSRLGCQFIKSAGLTARSLFLDYVTSSYYAAGMR